MTWDVYTKTKPFARKTYQCDASGFVYEMLAEIEWTADEKLMIDAMCADDMKIKKGQQYLQIKGLWDGDWQTFRGRLDMVNLCDKYDLWPEE